jgi:cephalosporin-C deacetylase
MPLVDKPLAELHLYQGTNPRPEDFDSFWDKSLAELRATDPQPELRRAKFQPPGAECFDLFFTGIGNCRIHAKYLRPKNSPSRSAAVLQFHGYNGNAGDWNDKLNYVSLGFCVAAMDCRGQGGLSEDLTPTRGDTLHGHIIRGLDDDPRAFTFRQVFLDTVQLARVVSGFDEVDENRVGAMGNSQGGALTLVCAALAPDLIKRAAPVFPFLCDYQRVWEMDLAKGAYEGLARYFRLFDPRHERTREIFTKLGYIDVQFLAPRIRAEILMGCGLMDTICPPSTQFAAYNKITSPKNVLVYPDFTHENLPGFNDAAFEFLSKL